MNLQRCKKGHFYNAERYAVCPHCVSGDRLDDEITRQAPPVLQKGAQNHAQGAPARGKRDQLWQEER